MNARTSSSTLIRKYALPVVTLICIVIYVGMVRAYNADHGNRAQQFKAQKIEQRTREMATNLH